MTPRELQIVQQTIRETAMSIFRDRGGSMSEHTAREVSETHTGLYMKAIRKAIKAHHASRQQRLPGIGTEQ